MKDYLIYMPSLPDGKYVTNLRMVWHEKVRIKIAKWLYHSISKPDKVEIETTTS